MLKIKDLNHKLKNIIEIIGNIYMFVVIIPMAVLTIFSLGSIWVVPLFVFTPNHPYWCVASYIFLLPCFIFLLKSD